MALISGCKSYVATLGDASIHRNSPGKVSSLPPPKGLTLSQNNPVHITIIVSGNKVILRRHGQKIYEENNLGPRPQEPDTSAGNTRVWNTGTALNGNISQFEFVSTNEEVPENANYDYFNYNVDMNGCPLLGPIKRIGNARATSCISKTWAANGCITAPMSGNMNWWMDRTKDELNRDMKLWATLKTDKHRTACYTGDKNVS